MPKVALVETKPSITNFKREFDDAFEFDQYQLFSEMSKKISFMPTGEALKYTSNTINSHTRVLIIMLRVQTTY